MAQGVDLVSARETLEGFLKEWLSKPEAGDNYNLAVRISEGLHSIAAPLGRELNDAYAQRSAGVILALLAAYDEDFLVPFTNSLAGLTWDGTAFRDEDADAAVDDVHDFEDGEGVSGGVALAAGGIRSQFSPRQSASAVASASVPVMSANSMVHTAAVAASVAPASVASGGGGLTAARVASAGSSVALAPSPASAAGGGGAVSANPMISAAAPAPAAASGVKKGAPSAPPRNAASASSSARAPEVISALNMLHKAGVKAPPLPPPIPSAARASSSGGAASVFASMVSVVSNALGLSPARDESSGSASVKSSNPMHAALPSGGRVSTPGGSARVVPVSAEGGGGPRAAVNPLVVAAALSPASAPVVASASVGDDSASVGVVGVSNVLAADRRVRVSMAGGRQSMMSAGSASLLQEGGVLGAEDAAVAAPTAAVPGQVPVALSEVGEASADDLFTPPPRARRSDAGADGRPSVGSLSARSGSGRGVPLLVNPSPGRGAPVRAAGGYSADADGHEGAQEDDAFHHGGVDVDPAVQRRFDASAASRRSQSSGALGVAAVAAFTPASSGVVRSASFSSGSPGPAGATTFLPGSGSRSSLPPGVSPLMAAGVGVAGQSPGTLPARGSFSASSAAMAAHMLGSATGDVIASPDAGRALSPSSARSLPDAGRRSLGGKANSFRAAAPAPGSST